MEAALSFLNGAEVNIADVDVNILKPGIIITRIQVTNPKNLNRNRLEIEKTGVDFLWNPVLEGKWVSEEAFVDGIAWDTERASPGKLLPQAQKEVRNALIDKIEERAQHELANSDLMRLPEILKNFDAQSVLKNVGELESVKQVQALKMSLTEASGVWDQKIRNIPGQSEADAIRSRVSTLGQGGNTISEIRTKLTELAKIKSDAEKLTKAVQEPVREVQSSVQSFGSQLGQVDDKVKEDQRSLSSRLKLPRVDTEGLTEELLGVSGLESIAEAQKWVEEGRRLMPPPSEEQAESPPPAIEPTARSRGRTYLFGTQRAYPSFWLKQIRISSRFQDGQYTGNLQGKATHLASEQYLTGEPTIIQLRGDFPQQTLSGVHAVVTLDHRTSVPKEKIVLGVDRYLLKDRVFSDSKPLSFKLNEAVGKTQLQGEFLGQGFEFVGTQNFSNMKTTVNGEAKWIRDLLKSTMNSLSSLFIEFRVSKKSDGMKISMKSNLGEALSRAIRNQMQAQLERAQAQVREYVEKQVGGQKKALEAQFSKLKTETLGRAEGRIQEVASANRAVDQKKTELEDRIKQMTEAEKKKAVNKAKSSVLRKFGR